MAQQPRLDSPVTRRLATIDEETFLEVVRIDQMFVDSGYTRPVSKAQIGRMALTGWSDRKAGLITLSLRGDGRFAVLDGNHRRHFAQSLGHDTMLARVFIDLTRAEEAELFEALNTIKPPSALDRFKSRLSRKEPLAVDIAYRLAAFGVHFSSVSGRDSKGSIQSVDGWERLYRSLGPEMFSHIASIIHRAWQHDPVAWSTKMVGGLEQFFARYSEEVDEQDLILRLQAQIPSRLIADAGAAAVRSESVNTLVGKRVVAIYNARRRTRHLSDWKERVYRPGESIYRDEKVGKYVLTRASRIQSERGT